jgi:hypothetical protein
MLGMVVHNYDPSYGGSGFETSLNKNLSMPDLNKQARHGGLHL